MRRLPAPVFQASALLALGRGFWPTLLLAVLQNLLLALLPALLLTLLLALLLALLLTLMLALLALLLAEVCTALMFAPLLLAWLFTPNCGHLCTTIFFSS